MKGLWVGIYRMVLMALCYISIKVQSFKVMSIKLAKSFCQVMPSVPRKWSICPLFQDLTWRIGALGWYPDFRYQSKALASAKPCATRRSLRRFGFIGWMVTSFLLIDYSNMLKFYSEYIYIYRSSCGMPFAIYYGWIFIQIITSISYQALSNLQSLSKHDRLERVDNI